MTSVRALGTFLSVPAHEAFPNQWLSAPAPARLQGYGLREVKPRMALPAVEAPAFLPPPFASSTPLAVGGLHGRGLAFRCARGTADGLESSPTRKDSDTGRCINM